MSKTKEVLLSLLKLAAIVFVATILGKIFTKLGFPETNIVVMYLLAVLLVARFILEDAAAGNCQVVIALTDSDEINLVICEMCKQFFHVKKTVALLT